MQEILAYEATAAHRLMFFFLIDSGGNAVAGETGRPQISINGGTWTNTTTVNIVSVGNGFHYIQLTQEEVNLVDKDIIHGRYISGNTVECPAYPIQIISKRVASLNDASTSAIDAAITSSHGSGAYTTANVSLLSTIVTHLTDIKGSGWTNENLKVMDSLIDLIKVQTDKIVFNGDNYIKSNPQGNIQATIPLEDYETISQYVHQGYGDTNIIITVVGDDSIVVDEATIIIRNSADTYTYLTKETNSNGIAAFTLIGGVDYVIKFRKAGYSADDFTATIIAGTPYTKTITASQNSLTVVDPGMQLLKGYVWDVNKNVQVGEDLYVKVSETPAVVSPGIFVTDRSKITTDALGYFEVQIVKGAKIVLKAGSYYSKEFTIDSNAEKWAADY